MRAEAYARALRASQNVTESKCTDWRAVCLVNGWCVGECGSERHSYGGGMISEVGWLSLCGTHPREFYLAPRGLAV